MKREDWRQISGDMNPSSYGGLIARFDGEVVELLEIQPTREYVGDGEALEVGFPFWSKGAYYDCDDLLRRAPYVEEAMACCGQTWDSFDGLGPDEMALAIAECLFRYGHKSEESTAGWARDVLGDRRVYWWGSKRAQGWRYLADEDREFRALQREQQREAS